MSPSLDAPGVAEVGKTALVTGGGGGIGLATARALAAAGFDVVAAGLEAAAASDTGIRYVQADIADLAGHAALLDAAGPLACLVNCAGVTSLVRGDMLELTPESFDRTMGVNLRGTFFLTQAVARRMLEAPPARSPRSIVSIGSINAEIVGENRADYCMSKTALGMMTRLFAARLATAGVAVFEVRPGIIRTAMTAPAAGRYDAFIAEGGVPARRWGEPEDVAAAVATLAQGGIPYATGIVIEVAGGMQLHRV